jgi:hypothetical protein
MEDQKYLIKELKYLNRKIYRFVRIRRKGEQQTTFFGEPFGPYLYRNLINNQLFASWTSPSNDIRVLYTGQYISINGNKINGTNDTNGNALKYYINY